MTEARAVQAAQARDDGIFNQLTVQLLDVQALGR